MRTNREVIEINLQSYQRQIEFYENIKKRNKREEENYQEYLFLLKREQGRLATLNRLGEEMYTEIYPYR